MSTPETFRTLALSYPNTIEQPHFERTAFKVEGKRIYATLHEPSASANIKLSPEEQKTFCELEGGGVYPVPNKWGEQGWTTFELAKVPEELLADALHSAYQDVVKTKKKK